MLAKWLALLLHKRPNFGKAISELQRKAEQNRQTLKRWVKSTNSTTIGSFVAAHEIARHGKPFTDREYMK